MLRQWDHRCQGFDGLFRRTIGELVDPIKKARVLVCKVDGELSKCRPREAVARAAGRMAKREGGDTARCHTEVEGLLRSKHGGKLIQKPKQVVRKRHRVWVHLEESLLSRGLGPSAAVERARFDHAKAARHRHKQMKHLAPSEPPLALALATIGTASGRRCRTPTATALRAAVDVYMHIAGSAGRHSGGVARVVHISHQNQVDACRHSQPCICGCLQEPCLCDRIVHRHPNHHVMPRKII